MRAGGVWHAPQMENLIHLTQPFLCLRDLNLMTFVINHAMTIFCAQRILTSTYIRLENLVALMQCSTCIHLVCTQVVAEFISETRNITEYGGKCIIRKLHDWGLEILRKLTCHLGLFYKPE